MAETNEAIERLERAVAELDAAKEAFSATCDKIKRRIEVLSRIPAVAALQRDLGAFEGGVGAVQAALDEYVEALKAVWPKEGFDGGER
jgi:predicted translin family RNA/ssDNA-binding protein